MEAAYQAFKSAISQDNVEKTHGLLQEYAVPLGRQFFNSAYELVVSVEMLELLKTNHFPLEKTSDVFFEFVKRSLKNPEMIPLLQHLKRDGFGFDPNYWVHCRMLKALKLFHAMGGNLMVLENGGKTNFTYALLRDDLGSVAFLSEECSEIDLNSAWTSVCSGEMANLLVEKGAEPPDNLFEHLLNNNKTKLSIYVWAADHEIELNGDLLEGFFNKQCYPSSDILDWLVEHGLQVPDDLLHDLLDSDPLPDIGVFRWAIDKGHDVNGNYEGAPYFHRARTVPQAKMLLKLGANPDLRYDGRNVTSYFINNGREQVMEFMLENGYFPNGTGYGARGPSMTKMLIKYGVDISVNGTHHSAVKEMLLKAYPRRQRNEHLKNIQTMITMSRVQPNKFNHWMLAISSKNQPYLNIIQHMGQLNCELVQQILSMIRCL